MSLQVHWIATFACASLNTHLANEPQTIARQRLCSECAKCLLCVQWMCSSAGQAGTLTEPVQDAAEPHVGAIATWKPLISMPWMISHEPLGQAQLFGRGRGAKRLACNACFLDRSNSVLRARMKLYLGLSSVGNQRASRSASSCVDAQNHFLNFRLRASVLGADDGRRFHETKQRAMPWDAVSYFPCRIDSFSLFRKC